MTGEKWILYFRSSSTDIITTPVDQMTGRAAGHTLMNCGSAHAACTHQHQDHDQTNQTANLLHFPLLAFDAERESDIQICTSI